MTDPRRPAEDLPPMVRDAIACANAEDGSEAQVARLAARVGPMLGLTAAAALAPAAASQAAAPKAGLLAGKVALAKALVAGGVVAGVVSGALAYQAIGSVPAPTVIRPRIPSSPVVTPRVEEAIVPVVPPEPSSPSVATAPRSHATAPPSATAPTTGALNEEARLLKRAGTLVGPDPDAALSAAEEHRRRFPAGALTHEREVIAIRALIALGRRGEATQRLARFERRFPSSPHLARFRESLGDP